jgi:diguanylate cyclase (GGDEF)-like protein/PAS domain S-box-containing protein
VVTNNQGYIQSVNNSFSNITGYTSEDIIGKTLAVLKSGKQDKYFYKKFWQKLIREGHWQGEIWNRRKNGEIYPEWLNVSSIRDDNEHIINYICQFTDITALKKSEEEKHFHAYHDLLTNLPNRHLLFERLKHLCVLHSESTVHFAVLFCDLDRFKLINDSLSHEVGDELLKSVANRFNEKLRDNDLIARSGGDEFIVVLEGEKALKNLDKICLQILSLFDEPFQTKFGEFKTSISVGVSQFPLDSENIRELISFADVAMLKVKSSGGNNYALFDAREKVSIMRRLELEQEIVHAIENEHFEVWYQPQVNTKTNEVYGVECLLRWIHPEQGIISPCLFIPIAEANGTIKALGDFVLKSACKQLRQWRVNNVFMGVMAINVSIRQFDRNDLLVQVKDILAQEMLPGSAIELEVTESLFSEDNIHLSPTLSDMRKLGIQIAIDDFGTGYSSLQRLRKLPVDNVKIDKCFIDRITRSKEDEAVLKAIILLSKTFKFHLIAEGIEKAEQAEKLNQLGCYNHQGFLYSKPLRAKDFEKWLIDYNIKYGALREPLMNKDVK